MLEHWLSTAGFWVWFQVSACWMAVGYIVSALAFHYWVLGLIPGVSMLGDFGLQVRQGFLLSCLISAWVSSTNTDHTLLLKTEHKPVCQFMLCGLWYQYFMHTDAPEYALESQNMLYSPMTMLTLKQREWAGLGSSSTTVLQGEGHEKVWKVTRLMAIYNVLCISC